MVLLDLKLPKVDGLEVLRRIKSDPVTRRIPVVVMTSSREERDIVESYDLGVNSYIVKPVDFDQFVRAVSDLGLYWLVLNQPPADAARGSRSSRAIQIARAALGRVDSASGGQLDDDGRAARRHALERIVPPSSSVQRRTIPSPSPVPSYRRVTTRRADGSPRR